MIGSTHETTPKLLSVLERPSRGQEVAHDAMLMPAAWLALDDDDWEWPPDLRHHLVLTDTTDALGGQGMIETLRTRLANAFSDPMAAGR